MVKRRLVFVLALIGFVALSLALGAKYLVLRLPGGLPFGTLLVILALMAAAGTPFLLGRPGRLLGAVSVVALVVAGAWFPVGLVLSGNAGLNFYNAPAKSALFDTITTGTAILSLTTMLWGMGRAAWVHRRRREAP